MSPVQMRDKVFGGISSERWLLIIMHAYDHDETPDQVAARSSQLIAFPTELGIKRTTERVRPFLVEDAN